MNAGLYLPQAEPCANHERFAVIPTNDPCEHAASLRDWSQDYLQLSAGPFLGEIVEASIGPIQIFKESIHQCVDQKANPRTGSFVMGVPVRMDDGGSWQGRQLNRDSLLTLEQNEELHFRTPQHSQILVAVIDFKTLNAFAQNASGNDVMPLIAASKAKKISPETAQGLRAVLSQLLASIGTTPDIHEHEASRKSVVETVLNSAFYILQSQSEGSGAPKTAHYVQRSIVERARQYIIERKSNPPSVSELSAHLKMSRRGLHHAFMNVLGINPATFLRYVRLHGARKDLLRADPSDSVNGIACKWGFWHMGMFSAYYKALFAELPSTTLRRTLQAKISKR